LDAGEKNNFKASGISQTDEIKMLPDISLFLLPIKYKPTETNDFQT
jgi:hypothetical protein